MRLRTQTHSAFKGKGFAGKVFEIRGGQHYAGAADVLFGVTEAAHGRHMYVCLKCLGICLLELFKLRGPGKRAYNVYVNAIRAPLCGGHAGETAYAFLIKICGLAHPNLVHLHATGAAR